MELRATRYLVDEHVATVVLARPERHNAWTGRMHAEYRWCMQQAEQDTRIRAVVVTGEGAAFCVGGDSRALSGHADRGGYDDGLPDEAARPGYGVHPFFDADFAWHFGLRLPVIAAVNGACAGVGLVLACYCDLRFVAVDAKLTTAAAKIGLPAEYGLSWLLPRLIGLTRAADLLLSSRVILGSEAASIGLANEALPASEVLTRAQEYARLLSTGVSPAAVSATKRQLYADLVDLDVGRAVRSSVSTMNTLIDGAEYREGVLAMREKRRPEF